MAAYGVLILRLIVPLSIFRWPFAGALLSIAADAADSVIFRNFGWGFLHPEDYQLIDKYFDLYYLTFEALVVARWRENFLRNIGLGLFFLRFAGTLLFEATGLRLLLFFAPNIFENFYLLVQCMRKLFPWENALLPSRHAVLLLLVSAFPKLIQEYIMHYMEYPLGIGTIWAYFR
ncbi:MAG: hypothetical protein HY471_00540 [Candidatus Sungbacteria bacterium]|nr:hypothetical protein [Candidatus Sungbacteria bacterium]